MIAVPVANAEAGVSISATRHAPASMRWGSRCFPTEVSSEGVGYPKTLRQPFSLQHRLEPQREGFRLCLVWCCFVDDRQNLFLSFV